MLTLHTETIDQWLMQWLGRRMSRVPILSSPPKPGAVSPYDCSQFMANSTAVLSPLFTASRQSNTKPLRVAPRSPRPPQLKRRKQQQQHAETVSQPTILPLSSIENTENMESEVQNLPRKQKKAKKPGMAEKYKAEFASYRNLLSELEANSEETVVYTTPMLDEPKPSMLTDKVERQNQNRRRRYRYHKKMRIWYKHEIDVLQRKQQHQTR